MLKRTISYEDFNGNQVEEVFYFNITKSELIELEAQYSGGFEESLTAIIDAQDKQRLIAEFKKIILFAYGKKSEDGKRFEKTDELRTEFSQMAAFNALFLELALDDGKAAEFINGVMPKDVVEEQDKPQGPPPLPKPTV